MDLNRISQRFINLSFYALFIIVPLILTPYNYELFEFNKMLAVYFLTIFIAAAWLARMIVIRQLIFKRTPLDWPLFLFLLSQILSTIFSLDPHTSIWGYYSRFHGGLLSTVCYLTLYYAFISNTVPAKKSLAVILSTAALVSLYAVAQRLGIDKHVWIQDVQSRVFSTLGQPNWLAAYLLAIIPFSGWLWPLLALAVYLTKSQSGYGAAAVISLLYLINRLIKPKVLKIIIVAGLIGAGIIYADKRHLIQPYPQVIAAINEENKTRVGGSDSMLIRRVVWQGAIAIWKHYPVFGSGVETFAYSYYNFRPAEHNLLSERDFLYNKAHNEYLNFLATSGAFGLTAYLWLCAAILILLLKRSMPLALGFISILITNFFGFSVVPIGLLFFLLPALAQPAAEKPALTSPKITNSQSILLVLIFLSAGYFGWSILKLWQADRLFNLGHSYLRANQIPTAANYLNQAISLSPNEPLFRNEYAESLAKLAYVANMASDTAKLAPTYSQEAINQSDLVLAANPVNLNYWRTRANIFRVLSAIDPGYNLKVIESLQSAIKLAPTDAKLYSNLEIYENLNLP